MKNNQRIERWCKSALLVMISFFVLSACAGAFPTDIPTDIPTDEEDFFLEETIQALQTEVSSVFTPSATATIVPATSIPPTITAPPNPTFSLPAARRIRFASGATYATARGTIAPGQTQNYVLEADQGQPMVATLSSQDNDVTMSITTEDGTTLLPASQGGSIWQGNLPAAQNYYIQIIGGAGQQDYSLAVSIPSRIAFAPGETSATVNGRTVDGNITSYTVTAQAGQTLNLVLNPDPNTAALTVWGFNDGQPYLRAQAGSTTFNMELPSTQDYIIDVVPQAGQEVDFTLGVEIE